MRVWANVGEAVLFAEEACSKARRFARKPPLGKCNLKGEIIL